MPDIIRKPQPSTNTAFPELPMGDESTRGLGRSPLENGSGTFQRRRQSGIGTVTVAEVRSQTVFVIGAVGEVRHFHQDSRRHCITGISEGRGVRAVRAIVHIGAKPEWDFHPRKSDAR